MKTFLKISLLTAILFTSFGAFANDDKFSVKVKAGDEKSIEFLINEGHDINLSILTAEDEVVYEQKIHATGAAKKVYNLESFPNGNYTLKLETPSKLTTYTIAIIDGKAILSTPLVTELFKPVLVKEKDMIILNVKNQDKDAVNVVIVNEYNDQLFSKAYTSATLTQKFDVSRTDAKELTFMVSYKGEEHIETFKIH
ncbi:hypothetical protein WG904_08345 [Pedobacter sp. Du54]|uniref:hypothetical protein n=1 Tax=Pedobacter anseongensis TaxID=3133439 RepID=UPI00309F3A44